MLDLLDFSAIHLRVGGRLVYWFPTTPEYTDDDLPQHPSLELVGNSEQSFGKWSRRLITMEKISNQAGKAFQLSSAPAHSKFRENYFNEI